uniref:Galactosyltransferase C-terminal domain-containing protein n=1 Tax=viral metagenome TaxID=1070528 RepID=A0A6C0B234_9ZZZZ
MSDTSENITVEIFEPIIDNITEEVPVTEEPVSNEVPVTEEPVVKEVPVTEEPVVEEPVVEEVPVTEELVVEEPVAEEPVVEEPVTEEPVTEEPVAEEPVVEEPVTEEPVTEEPVQEATLSIERTESDAPVSENELSETNEVSVPELKPEPIHVADPVPKYVFIVPYRDRQQQLAFFKKHMSFVLEDTNPNYYKIFFIHQCDQRSFNRGAMKNIGFLYIKDTYPNDYRNITLVFNDIDTMPYTKNFFNYDTTPGNVKHFYGFKYALGGIVSIKAGDFERINGYPNFWAWGYEDNLLQKRVLNNGIFIDRNQYYPLMDKNIFQMKDGLERLVNRAEFDKFLGLTLEGISNIQGLQYDYDEQTGFVNVKSFITGTEELQNQSTAHNLTNGNRPFNAPILGGRRRPAMGMSFF